MGRKIFVTGGAGGLGMEIVRQHLELGDAVWATDINGNPDMDALIAENGKLAFIKCDISKTSSVDSAIGGLHTEIGRLDCLYSCAGIFRREDKTTLPGTDLDLAAGVYEVNAVGFLRVVKALFPAIRGGSVIMCVTSEAGSIGENWRDGEYSYCMSKAAENMACAILQKHFDKAGQDTRVMCIHPGWLRTNMGGPDAFANPQVSVDPSVSAEKIIGIARDIECIPKKRMYMDYNRNDIAW